MAHKVVDVLHSHGCLLLPQRILLTPAPPGTPSFATATAMAVQSSSHDRQLKRGFYGSVEMLGIVADGRGPSSAVGEP
jgi:hypothetical protein